MFREYSAGRSQVELAREYRTGKLPTATRLLLSARDQNEDPSKVRNAESDVGRAIGWVVVDADVEPGGAVVCVGIVARSLVGHGNVEQEIIECIVLSAISHSSNDESCSETSYVRVGRGRIVEKGWLSGCKTQTVCIV